MTDSLSICDGAFATGAALRGQFNALNDRIVVLEAALAATAKNQTSAR